MKTKTLNIRLVFAALAVLTFAGVHSAVAQGTWTTKAPMPTPRLGLGAASVNGIVYAVGGGDYGCGTYSTVEAYDPATDTWSTKASMPTARYSLAVVAVNGMLYAIGGGGNCNDAFDRATVEAYNPTNDTWTTKSPMPAALNNISASVVNGIIYVVGGDNTANHPAFAYNPATDTWTTKVSVPPERHSAAAGSIGGIMYWAGGQDGSGTIGPLGAYSPATDSWTTKAPIPTLRPECGVGVINGKLYVVGGYSHQLAQYTGAMEVYDPATDSWSTQTSMPTARGLAVAVANGVLYALGGYSGTILANNEAFTPPVPAKNGLVPTLPTGAKFNTFGVPACNNSGNVAFQATLMNGFGGVVASNNAAIYAGGIGAESLIVRSSQFAPDANGTPTTVRFSNFSDPAYNNAGEIAFRGILKAGIGGVGTTNDTGLWSTYGGTNHLVAREGDVAPDTGGATFASFTSFALPDEGDVVFLGVLQTSASPAIGATNNTGIWAFDAYAVLHKLTRTGDSVPINGTNKTLKTLTFLPSVAYSPGQSRSVNNAGGKLVYKATFTDATTAILSASYP